MPCSSCGKNNNSIITPRQPFLMRGSIRGKQFSQFNKGKALRQLKPASIKNAQKRAPVIHSNKVMIFGTIRK